MKIKAAILTLSIISGASVNMEIEKNGMVLTWNFEGDFIQFQISAPSLGWLAIGLNENTDITGTYFLMGRIINNRPEVVEHYTISPGNYKSFVGLNEPQSVSEIFGTQTKNRTTITFSITTIASSLKARDIIRGKKYLIWMAYSNETDFQHHSAMRTSIYITF